jgi:flagella basal body P-ring formation protein FlgA
MKHIVLGACMPLLAAAPLFAQDLPSRTVRAATLKEDLTAFSQALLAATPMSVDAATVRVSTSRPLQPDEALVARPLWPLGDAVPPLPLVFELKPAGSWRGGVQAKLMVTFFQEVMTLKRRVERSQGLGCDDLETSSVPAHRVPKAAMRPPCTWPAQWVAKRPLVKGEIARVDDARAAPAVVALAPVDIRVHVGSIVLDKPGVALSDAMEGDAVRVRVKGSLQSLNARVIGRNLAEVEGQQ